MKNLVKIEARVYAPNNFSSENKVELLIKEGVRNPKFPNQPVKTYANFVPNNKNKHMKKSTLDYLLLAQGKAITFGERDKVVTVILEDIPAEFIKGHKSDGSRYFAIKADLSNKPGETHFKWFFADPMTSQMCEEFITDHKFEESEETPVEEDDEDSDDEDKEELK